MDHTVSAALSIGELLFLPVEDQTRDSKEANVSVR